MFHLFSLIVVWKRFPSCNFRLFLLTLVFRGKLTVFIFILQMKRNQQNILRKIDTRNLEKRTFKNDKQSEMWKNSPEN